MAKKIKFPASSIKNLQQYISDKIDERGFKDESLHERLLILTEELGELVKACRKISGMYTSGHSDQHDKIGHEITDVINMIFAVGIELGIDIEKEFVDKEDIIDQRNYNRSKNS